MKNISAVKVETQATPEKRVARNKYERKVLQKNPKRTRDMSYEEFLEHTRKLKTLI